MIIRSNLLRLDAFSRFYSHTWVNLFGFAEKDTKNRPHIRMGFSQDLGDSRGIHKGLNSLKCGNVPSENTTANTTIVIWQGEIVGMPIYQQEWTGAAIIARGESGDDSKQTDPKRFSFVWSSFPILNHSKLEKNVGQTPFLLKRRARFDA